MPTRPSLPPPTTPLDLPTFQRLPFKPFAPPSFSQSSQLPPLPSPPRQPIPSLAASYTLSTHILPAVRPRSAPYIHVPDNLSPEYGQRITDKREKRQWVGRVVEWLLDVRKKFTSGQLDDKDQSGEGMWNVVNRYVLKESGKKKGKGVTLFVLHATGFLKEIWEPALAQLVSQSQSSSSDTYVEEIWAWESAQHGDAALLNESINALNGLCDWRDNARDVVNFLSNYLPLPSKSQPNYPPELYPSVHLQPVPESLAQQRLERGFVPEGRTLVVVGHSYGGCASALAAINYPAMFTGGLILVDPVILPFGSYYQDVKLQMTAGAVGRRTTWKDRQEALSLFSASPFFSVWDPEVLNVYVECGLTDFEGGVRLKISGFQEATMFADTSVAYEVFERLPELDPRVELKWVLPGNAKQDSIGGVEMQPYRAWRRPQNASNVIIPGAGHLITQEAPQALAEEMWAFILKKAADGSGEMRARL
ncbi:hypothetical protein NEOLEDRAFT_1181002 [Neolentinus lepideus HHB14362 ss-1]|uniref:AB hydrolase-1 domain-containing protein n=1 Tax=Neolentinus lepideus HHB14362 ss-1 TaxID=1314782 RepID=A0A165QD31_9AGAM|nr:hypothetical protein NEOLEDRAFT_1181002 [Neolentinus lepideus HHB14362 ss-1]